MPKQEPRDDLYADPKRPLSSFAFDERVARVFPDMIRRSIPGYSTVIDMTAVLAGQYVQPGSHCYDLGCSLGASSAAISRGAAKTPCRIFGIDSSPAMLKRAGARLAQLKLPVPVTLICADVLETNIENASLVVLNFTLQFIQPRRRLELIVRIYNGLRPGGILVLSEKLAFTDPEAERLQIEMHHAFKRANGYNDLEISRKRSALEAVLIPESLDCHRDRLAKAGFGRSDLWFQCFNFVSLVARR